MTTYTTFLCMILDESGSMYGNEDDLVEGFNALLDDQMRNKGQTKFCLIKFSDDVTMVYNNIPLQKVPKMTRGLYRPYGRTALYDAISEGIKIVDKNVASFDRVIVIIFTDGEENASRYSNDSEVKAFFDKFQRRGNWSFLYIGENSKEFSEKMGIPLRNTIDFRHRNVKDNFIAASHACTTLRESGQLQGDNLLVDFSRTEPKEVETAQTTPPKTEAVNVPSEPNEPNNITDALKFVTKKAAEIRKFAKSSLINLFLVLLFLFTFYHFFPYFMAIILVVFVMDYYEIGYEILRLE